MMNPMWSIKVTFFITDIETGKEEEKLRSSTPKRAKKSIRISARSMDLGSMIRISG